jgi:hypothetical protein
MSPLKWCSKSARNIAAELNKNGFRESHILVSKILRANGYSLFSNKKKLEGKQHPERRKQFNHIKKEVKKALKSGNPFVSVDSKCKEYLGNYYRKGQTWRPKDSPIEVKDHDFHRVRIKLRLLVSMIKIEIEDT